MAFDDHYRLSAHAVITDGDGRVLLLRATYGSLSWGLPGGAVDPGETVLTTLGRECAEELGCDVEIGPLTGIYYHQKLNSHAMLFRCTLKPGAAVRLSAEHSEFRWFPVEELSPVQQRRVLDCLEYDGRLKGQVF